MPAAWCCPCCGLIWSPNIAFCAMCTLTGQLNDEMRQHHECPLVAMRTKEALAAVLPAKLLSKQAPAPVVFRVEPRPDIKARNS